MEPVRFDENASQAIIEEVWSAVTSCKNSLYNPSSIHSGGQAARARIENARSDVLELVDAPQGARVIFTSGATEANNHAFFVAEANLGGDEHDVYFLSTPVEHVAVLEPLEQKRKEGGIVRWLPPSFTAHETGALLDDLNIPASASVFCSCMAANNETGQVFPLESLEAELRKRFHKVFFHSDAVQAFGRVPFSMKSAGLDLVSISGHKIGALSGTGALVVGPTVDTAPFVLGGPQELHWRGGTENVLGIIAFGIAAENARKKQEQWSKRMGEVTSYLRERLSAELTGSHVHSFGEESLPNTLSVRFDGVRADDLVVALDLRGVYVSSGAACASGKPQASHVLLAHGLNEEQARQSIRISVNGEITDDAAQRGVEAIIDCVNILRESSR